MILLIKQYIFYKSRKSNVLSIDEIKKCLLAYYQTEKWSHGINMKQKMEHVYHPIQIIFIY